ncbi:selenide, water dikinase SelD [Nonomuraea sp. KM90]|uniref:selenide, water dikinase SelD n=1 Tax=Nonomuraea sp. KM90 TaxID=3457428 RepID=UPI003FCCB953
MTDLRLTQYARGGGCSCKIPPGELEAVLAGFPALGGAKFSDAGGTGFTDASVAGFTGPTGAGEMLIGLEHGDDAAVVRLDGDRALVSTVDFFAPVVDDPYDFGRIAAANALSDVYAVGGEPLVALNLLGWPRDLLPMEAAREVLRGGVDVAGQAGCAVAGGHSIDDAEPKYGLAVTGLADPASLLRLDAGRPGLPLCLSKPLGVGVLNSRHKATGDVFPEAVASMTALNRDASRHARAAGARCATDVTGFGLLGHLFKLARASGVTAVVSAGAVPYLEGAREAVRDGYVSGGTRRNLAWVAPHLSAGGMPEEELLLLADAQTSGGLLVAGEIPGAVVIGELVARGEQALIVR